MQAIYPYAQIIHLICAIIFVGFLFFDVVIFGIAKRYMPSEVAKSAKMAISKTVIKIMPICVFLLIITGGMMMSSWVNSDIGYFGTNLQKLFMLKVFLGLMLFLIVLVTLTCKFILKRPAPFGDIHKYVLCVAFVIVLIAKIMFLV
ncbi:MAG: copper resistance protein CopD [Campylobacter sp.]|nr:copper resistance protein CopD [Campylobacter sp.]